jgi:hypothetical protein
LVVKDFFGCDEIGVSDVNLAYVSGASDGFQFKGNVRVATCVLGEHDFRIKFGSSGARFCHLVCADGCVEDVCIP